MPTSSPASSRVQTPSDAGTFGVDNSDIVPKDSPFYNAGLVDGFPAKISAYTPTVRRIITPANMLSVYKCELVYPSLQTWGVLPNGRMSRAWRPLGYKRADLRCGKAKGRPTIVVGLSIPSHAKEGTVCLEACWSCQVEGTGDTCAIYNVQLTSQGEVRRNASIHNRPPLVKSSKKRAADQSNHTSPTAAKTISTLDPPSVPTANVPTETTADDATEPTNVAATNATTLPDPGTDSQSSPTPCFAKVSTKVTPLSAIARKRKFQAGSAEGTTPKIPKPADETVLGQDWIQKFQSLAESIPNEIISRSEHDKVREELDKARRINLDLESKLKITDLALRNTRTRAEEAQASNLTLEQQVRLLQSRIDFFRSAAIDTILEVDGENGGVDLEQLDDHDLWFKVAG